MSEDDDMTEETEIDADEMNKDSDQDTSTS